MNSNWSNFNQIIQSDESVLSSYSQSPNAFLRCGTVKSLSNTEPVEQVQVEFFLKVSHTCQVLRKSKSETACAPLIFAYNLVIKRAEKSGAQVLRVRFFPLLNRHKLLRERDKQYRFVRPISVLSTTLNLLSICKSTMPNKYTVPVFVHLQCILTHDSYANQDSDS